MCRNCETGRRPIAASLAVESTEGQWDISTESQVALPACRTSRGALPWLLGVEGYEHVR